MFGGQCRRWIARDEMQHLHGVQVGVRRVALGELVGKDSQTPDVCLGVVPALLHDLGRHPVGRADERRILLDRRGELPRDAKVGELDSTITGEQYVGRFDVAMQLVFAVQVH